MSTVGDDLIESMTETSEPARASKTQAVLEADLLRLAEESGFPYYYCCVKIRKSQKKDITFRITNYPQDWLDAYLRSQMIVADPIRRMIKRRFAAFALEDAPFCDATPPQLCAETERYGLHQGLCVHVHNLHGEHGYVLLSGMPAPWSGAERDFTVARATKLLCRICESAHAMTDLHVPAPTIPRLGRQPTKVLSLLAEGYARKQVADQMGIAIRTVDMHLATARRKLGSRTTDEAIARATSTGLIGRTRLH